MEPIAGIEVKIPFRNTVTSAIADLYFSGTKEISTIPTSNTPNENKNRLEYSIQTKHFKQFSTLCLNQNSTKVASIDFTLLNDSTKVYHFKKDIGISLKIPHVKFWSNLKMQR